MTDFPDVIWWENALLTLISVYKNISVRNNAVIVTVHPCPFSGPACYEYETRLANTSSYHDANGTSYYIGTLEVCINGIYYPSCLDSLPENICSNIYSANTSKLVGFVSFLILEVVL